MRQGKGAASISGGRRSIVVAAALALAGLAGQPCAGAVVPRADAPSGSIVSINGDETVRFVADEAWRSAEIAQDLLAGDALRTGPAGALALRFVDQTLIRMHRNSALIVKQVLAAGAAQLRLDAGRIWARADEAGDGVDIETPSATVAIRGTDWSLSVEGTRTTLVVIAGQVVMSNPQGSITVNQGEAAVAEIGRAPAKIILTNPPGREQLLYYVSLRDAFSYLPLAPLSNREAREHHARLLNIPEARRTTGDWLDLAELGLPILGRRASAEALGKAQESGPLSYRDEARAKLIEATLAARSRDWDLAARLFAEAEPALSGERRFAALFGRFLAYAIAGRRQEAESLYPALERFRGTRSHILAMAWVRANIGELEEALADLEAAHRQHPEDTLIAVLAAQIAIALGREEEARTYSNDALAADPDDPDALLTEATLLHDYDWQSDAAAERLKRAAEIAPGLTEIWNRLGLVRDDQGDPGGAEDAFRTAIGLDPDDPVPHANYAVLLLDADRLGLAKREIDKMMELDPSFSVGLLAHGRWLAQQGNLEEARDAFLDAVVANPGLSNSYLALAIAHYERGDVERAEQALENADALDKHDPLVPLVDTVIALDHAEADRAIISARESYRRYRDRGGVENPFAATRDGGSYLNAAFSQLSLADWGRFYGDLTFNPFDAGSQFYQAAAPRVDLLEAGSAGADGLDLGSVLQGLLLDPLSVSARNRYTDLLRRPFLDTTLTAGAVLDAEGEDGWNGGADIQGFANPGLPVAFTLGLGRTSLDRDQLDQANGIDFANLLVGTNLTLRDRLLIIGSYSKAEDEVPREIAFLGGDNEVDARAYAAGAGYSHTFGPRNVLMAAVMAAGVRTEADVRADVFGLPFKIDSSNDEEGIFYGLAHAFEAGRFTFHYGAEGQTIDRSTGAVSSLGGIPTEIASEDGEGLQGQSYADLRVRISPTVLAEVGLYLSFYEDGIDPDEFRIEPRAGLAWLASEGQWLRAAYREETQFSTVASLAPVATLGLTPALTPVEPGGATRSLIFRWDSEWSERFFTAIEVEHQEIDKFAAGIRDSLDPLGALLAEEGRIDSASFFANAWLGHGIGLFGQLTLAHSDNTSGGSHDGERLPLIPDWQASFGATWVHPSQISLTVAEILIGERAGDVTGNVIDSAAITNIEFSWQPFDKHLEVAAAVVNVFDEDYELATGISAPGTTFLLSGALRF